MILNAQQAAGPTLATVTTAVQFILPDQEWPEGDALASNEDSIQSVEENNIYTIRKTK